MAQRPSTFSPASALPSSASTFRMPGSAPARTPAQIEEERKRNNTKKKNKQNPASTYNQPAKGFLSQGNLLKPPTGKF